MTVFASRRAEFRRVAPTSPLSTELAGLALVAGRVAAVVERAIDGVRLSSDDRRHLRTARDQLHRNLSPGGGTRLGARHVHSSGLIVSAAKSTAGIGDPNAVLRGFADDLDRLSRGQPAQNPQQLLDYYDDLAERARRQSRGPGETVTRKS